MQSLIIKENDAGQRLDKFLHKCLPQAPDGFLYKMLRKKNITLNGKKAEGKELLKLQDEVKLFFSEETYQKFAKRESAGEVFEYENAYQTLNGIEIVYEDHHILVLNKPCNMLSQKASLKDVSVNEWVIGYLLKKGVLTKEELARFKPSVCNRLDRNTTGLLLAGKTLAGTQLLSRLLKDRNVHKYYRLYVKGCVKKEQLIDGYLVKDHESNKVTVLKQAGSADKEAYIQTFIKPIQVFEDKTLLEAELITGKTHQIRAHLSSIGHPLIGDYKYGDKKYNDYYKKQFQIHSQLLHAYRLEFPVLPAPFEAISGKTFIANTPALFDRLADGSLEIGT